MRMAFGIRIHSGPPQRCRFPARPMSTDNPPAPMARGWVRVLIAFVVAFDMAAFFQWADGAFQSEFGGHAEEAENFLAAVRTRDALVRAPARDGAAAENHAAPQTARRHGFSQALGVWMAAFGTSRIAALLFMTALAATTTTLIFHTVHRESGMWAAITAALLWLCAPAVRESYETLLPEQSGALILTGAALLWARMMDGGNPRRTAALKWIGVVALIAIGGVLGIAGAHAVNIVRGDPFAAAELLKECVSVLGIAATAFAIAGAVICRRAESPTSAVRVAMLALVAGVLVARWMKSAVPDVRLLIVATPAFAILAVRGAVALAGAVASQALTPAVAARRRALWIFLLLLLALPIDLLHAWKKDWHGFGPLANALVEESHGPVRVLVVSDPRGEAMFCSEIAMRDRERLITVERGSETLVEAGSGGPHTKPQERFADDRDLLTSLTSGRIHHIVLDGAVPYETHAGYHDQLRHVLEINLRNFWPTHESAFLRDGEPQARPLKIYRVIRPDRSELP